MEAMEEIEIQRDKEDLVGQKSEVIEDLRRKLEENPGERERLERTKKSWNK